MERELPKIDLGNDTFFVDQKGGGLRNSQPPFNVLPFDKMQPHVEVIHIPDIVFQPFSAYSVKRFLYDKNLKEMTRLPKGCKTMPEGVSYMEILNLAYLDPAGVAMDILGVRYDELPEKYHDVNRHHLATEIPVVRIFDHDYFVDTSYHEIRHISDRDNKVSFSNIIVPEHDNHMIVWFDPVAGKLWNNSAYSTDKEIVPLTLPTLDILDPIGFQRTQGDSVGFVKLKQTDEQREWQRQYFRNKQRARPHEGKHLGLR